MIKIGLWHITNNLPTKIEETQIDLEKKLEDWIEEDPSLVQAGLEIVRRQLPLEGGYLDLLALDPQGRWVVIEIKRGHLRRETVAQVVDYASSFLNLDADELIEKVNSYLKPKGKSIEDLLKERSAEEAIEADNREILMIVVGAGKAPGLERMVSFMSNQYQIPISAVSFSVFQSPDGNQLLIRELTEPEFDPKFLPTVKRTGKTVDQICELARSAGVGKEFMTILHAGKKHGLYIRPFRKSIMYTPPFQRNRMLFTVWAEKRNNGIKIYVTHKEFAEFYSISETEAAGIFSFEEEGWQGMDTSGVEQFISSLNSFFDKINARK